jgi:hypothetical protein
LADLDNPRRRAFSPTMKSTALAGTSVLGLIVLLLPALALAHGEEHAAHDDMPASSDGADQAAAEPQSYFALAAHSSLIYAHIALMVLAWVFVLPVAVMLSIARSRHTLIAQFVFLATNSLGVLLGTAYRTQTPDLYPSNAHHTVGWVATWVACAHVLVSLVGHIAGAVAGARHRDDDDFTAERQAFMALPTHEQPYRLSGESGQSTEVGSGGESSRSNSVSTLAGDAEERGKEFGGDDDLEDLPLDAPSHKGFLASYATKAVSFRVWKYVEYGYSAVDRVILPLGFIALTTGIVTWARFFEGHAIYGGLAHWIKGSVFFWFGLLTLGRWAGSFADLGWAWNARLRTAGAARRWQPSAEFVESALIFFYGITNIFLEHLGNQDGSWSPQDLEHVAITVLFIGGGLCGMLIESSWIRDLLNTTAQSAAHQDASYSEEERQALEPPATYDISINPMPALVILLLGIMMGSHHQHSQISSMVHGQWGRLLLGASFTRGLTYVVLYLKPPTSALPSRPPTELLTAFGLLSGGIIFMASSKDTIDGMVHYNLDAMFMYTVTLGCTGLVMAWEIIVLAIKGWAVRREQRSSF